MADIRPFRAVRPDKEKAERIAALPYDVVSEDEARAEVKREPLSFLKIDRAEVNFEKGTAFSDPAVYKKAAELFHEMEKDGDFISDEKPCYYIYELTMDGRVQTGITAVSAIDDYIKGTIKKHENTRADKEVDRIEHVSALNAQTGPIFLSYRKNDALKSVTDRVKESKAPLYDFSSLDGIRHRAFIIDDDNDINSVREAFCKMDSIYIADGHHRCASAVKVGLKKRKEEGDKADKNAEYNYFLSVLFPDNELKILDYNRVIYDLNGLSEERFFDRIRRKFDIRELDTDLYKPEKKGLIGMYISGKWYELKFSGTLPAFDPVESLDVSVLQNELLAPVLNIEDPRTDPRIDFIGGIRGIKVLTQMVDSKEAVAAFAMYPTSMDELFAVADAGLLMPPKSTWFEPKLRSGLFIHKI